MKLLTAELSAKCRAFVISHWGKDALAQAKERPVSWVVYQANPHLRSLRRKHKHLPLISVRGEINRIRVELSSERKKPRASS